MVNTPNRFAPEIVNEFAPGPVMVKSPAIAGNADANVIVPVTPKVIVSPDAAEVRAARNVPVPLSARFVTVSAVA
jgi:hypothetical protein